MACHSRRQGRRGARQAVEEPADQDGTGTRAEEWRQERMLAVSMMSLARDEVVAMPQPT